MKWYNKDKTTMIDLDKVYSYYHYNGYFNVNCFGELVSFRDEEAKEVWELLKNYETKNI